MTPEMAGKITKMFTQKNIFFLQNSNIFSHGVLKISRATSGTLVYFNADIKRSCNPDAAFY